MRKKSPDARPGLRIIKKENVSMSNFMDSSEPIPK
jgi:hypothetical protein